MGTYYSITAETDQDLQFGIDSVFAAFQRIFSTYDPLSEISGLNSSANPEFCLDDQDEYWKEILNISKKVYQFTDGSFDPTVMPLVKYWGFATEKFEREDHQQTEIDELLKSVGFDKITWEKSGTEVCFTRSVPGMSLDLSAVAKGYGVEVLADHFTDLGLSNFMIEIGGEITARGKNERGTWWAIGIEKPISSSDIRQREQHAIIELRDMSIASSGNYRNFYEIDGRLIGHTIHPKTGMPEQNDLLSVSVITPDCAYSDALATGFMVMGYKAAKSVADSIPDINALFIRLDNSSNEIVTETSYGFDEFLLKQL